MAYVIDPPPTSSNGGPAWLVAAVKLGVPAVIALALVFFLAKHVDGEIHAIGRALDDHISDMKLDQRETRWLLGALCRNAADTEQERTNCTPPSEGR